MRLGRVSSAFWKKWLKRECVATEEIQGRWWLRRKRTTDEKLATKNGSIQPNTNSAKHSFLIRITIIYFVYVILSLHVSIQALSGGKQTRSDSSLLSSRRREEESEPNAIEVTVGVSRRVA